MIRVIAEARTSEKVAKDLIAKGWKPKGEDVLWHGASKAVIVSLNGWAKAYISLASEIERSAVLIEEGIHRRRLSERGA